MTWSPRPIKCSCEPQDHEECGLCKRARSAAAYKRLTAEEKAYDRRVDPLGAYHTDFPDGCSCHISPPCSYCTREADEVNDGMLAARDRT